ncbi:MAG: hypothetical protein V7K14_21790 [Nostoc sp.]|uniref:hypothetical protein n=1 Tax=Nostoc sp. TaxID=1180 RepID=UPI002FFA4961
MVRVLSGAIAPTSYTYALFDSTIGVKRWKFRVQKGNGEGFKWSDRSDELHLRPFYSTIGVKRCNFRVEMGNREGFKWSDRSDELHLRPFYSTIGVKRCNF